MIINQLCKNLTNKFQSAIFQLALRSARIKCNKQNENSWEKQTKQKWRRREGKAKTREREREREREEVREWEREILLQQDSQ